MNLLPFDSLLSPHLKGVSLLRGPRPVLRLAHAWMARWALTGGVHVVDCAGAFRPLQILHSLEDEGLPAFAMLESIEVQRPRTPFQFLGASRVLTDVSDRPVVMFAPLKYFLASASSPAASTLLLDAFRTLLVSAQSRRARVLLVEPEQPSRMHSKGLSVLSETADRTWTISAQGVESLTGRARLRTLPQSSKSAAPASAAM